MADFRVEQTYGEIERMVHEEVVYRLLSGPPEEAHLQPTKEEQEWAERVANEVTQGVMSQMDEAEGLAERLEGTGGAERIRDDAASQKRRTERTDEFLRRPREIFPEDRARLAREDGG